MIRNILLATAAVALTFGCDKGSGDASTPETTTQSSAQTAQATNNSTTAQAGTANQTAAQNKGLGPGTEEQQQLLVQAKSAFLNEQWDEAERLFKELTETGEISGPQVTAYIALGSLYADSDRQADAQKLYEELMEKAPEVPEVHFVMARTLAEQGETTKAMKAYERTIKMQPDYLQAMVELGGLYAKSGRKEEAEKLFYMYEKKVYKLAAALEDQNTATEDKLGILEIFSFVDDDRANEAIAKQVLDQDPAVRERAIWLAVDLELGAVKPNLKVLAENDPDRRVRLVAKEALKQLADAPEAPVKPKVVDKK